MANRIWLHHFGQGIVRTPGDFGSRGEPPTHPELLDWLATEVVRSGWSLKHLHRLIVLSSTYRQSSREHPEALRVDPDNTLLSRFPRRRLDFEATRDALLAVSGTSLESTIGGPSVQGILTPGSRKRTLYGWVDRLHVPGLYRTFDFPSPDASSAQRDRTTVAPQALFFLNHPFVLHSARALLARPEVRGADAEGRVDRLYQLCFGRPPSAAEVALALGFVRAGQAGDWERYAQALLLTNELVFVD
jgi:hypothetical protein